MTEEKKDAQQAPEEQTASAEDLSVRLAEAEEELRICQEKVMRLAAELDNFKKRIEREKAEHMKYALAAFANDLLPFLDNLERAVSSAKESRDIGKLTDGIEITLTGYLKTLERYGLRTFAAVGQRFDPTLHEALSVVEHPDYEENTVVEELLRGYILHERVLRPALVTVSKKPSPPPEGGGQSGGDA
ncbi:MAG: nucleotide exchange factor GrpE [Deltaproteobacteria bacterium]